MPKNKTNFGVKLTDMVYLVSENDVREEMGEAFASVMFNPTVMWAKFVLTDDMRNGNGQRIPREEFSNLIRSGLHMPVKMARGEISRGHDGSEPLGSITHLKEVSMPDGTNAIVALAALWGQERPADVSFIKQRFAEQNPVDISWEILYEDYSYNEEQNSLDLLGTVLRAATIVGDPAYQGRTRVLSVAAKKWSKAYISELPNTAFLYVNGEEKLFPIVDSEGMVDRTRLRDAIAELADSKLPSEIIEEKTELVERLISQFESGASIEQVTSLFVSNTDFTEEEELKTIEELQAQVAEMEPKLTDALSQLEAKEALLAERDTEIETLKQQVSANDEELTALRLFKAELDAAAEKEEKLNAIKTKFTEAGITKDEEYFAQNSEKLLGMEESTLDFMIQELVANLPEEGQSATASHKKTKIPNLPSEEGVDASDPKALGRLLREQGKK